MQLAEDMENQVFWPELGWGFQKPDSDSDVKHLSNGCKSIPKLEDWIFMLYYHENHIWTYKKCLKILYIAFSWSLYLYVALIMPEPREPITQ